MSFKNIGPEEFEKAVNENEDAVIIDVRGPGELVEGSIEGHVMINMMHPAFVSKIEELDRDKTYFLYCRSGGRSSSACGFMAQKGFSKLYNLSGGIMAWNQYKNQ